jgi:hypothetical protein
MSGVSRAIERSPGDIRICQRFRSGRTSPPADDVVRGRSRLGAGAVRLPSAPEQALQHRCSLYEAAGFGQACRLQHRVRDSIHHE